MVWISITGAVVALAAGMLSVKHIGGIKDKLFRHILFVRVMANVEKIVRRRTAIRFENETRPLPGHFHYRGGRAGDYSAGAHIFEEKNRPRHSVDQRGKQVSILLVV